jgi:hypothetical protein
MISMVLSLHITKLLIITSNLIQSISQPVKNFNRSVVIRCMDPTKRDKPSFLSPSQGTVFRERSLSFSSTVDEPGGTPVTRTRSGSAVEQSHGLTLLGRERANSMLRRALDDNKREPIWWRPLTIEGIEGITIQVDTVIKQFQEIHLSKDPEVSKVVSDFIRSIEQQINKLSQFYRENRGGIASY